MLDVDGLGKVAEGAGKIMCVLWPVLIYLGKRYREWWRGRWQAWRDRRAARRAGGANAPVAPPPPAATASDGETGDEERHIKQVQRDEEDGRFMRDAVFNALDLTQKAEHEKQRADIAALETALARAERDSARAAVRLAQEDAERAREAARDAEEQAHNSRRREARWARRGTSFEVQIAAFDAAHGCHFDDEDDE